MLPLFGKMTAHKNIYSTLLKWLCFALWGAVVVLLAAATIIEKSRGTAFAIDHIYTARWMVALWCVATLAAVAYLLQTKLYRRVVVFALHASLLLILIGAFITHVASRHGVVHLSVGNTTNEYILDDGTEEQLPFRLTLRSFDILYHRGSQAPMNYISVFEIDHDGTIVEGEVSMNNIFRYEGYRLSQASFDEDGRGVCLSVAYDRWGIGVTYAGYAALLLSIIAFMCSREKWKYLLTDLSDFCELFKLTQAELDMLLAEYLKIFPIPVAYKLRTDHQWKFSEAYRTDK